ENAMTVFYHQLADEYLEPLAADARAGGTELLVGLPYMDREANRYYSSLMSLGETRGVYHKRHLVPFGEYVPLESLLRGLIGFFDLPMSGFSHGAREQRPLVVGGQPVAPSVCYEDAYGEELIHFLPEATLLVNGSNNAWYGDSLAPHQHLQISRMRARETGRELLRATTNGISAIVDHRGALVATTPQFQEYVLEGTVQPRTGATPYVRFGNWPVVCAAGLVTLLLVVVGRRCARARRRAEAE
ncbi:MAG: apolipoprotein N-acyltransferase, partial [Pseudomonadota bacterium]